MWQLGGRKGRRREGSRGWEGWEVWRKWSGDGGEGGGNENGGLEEGRTGVGVAYEGGWVEGEE